VTAVGVALIVSSERPTTMDANKMIDKDFSAVQQEILKAIRHIALRNNKTQDYVRVAMQTVLDNNIITL
jgi:hypothetical protein